MQTSVSSAAKKQVIIKPQDGPQTDFMASSADIVIYGGAAGGGKTYGLLLDPMLHYHAKNFGAVIFRETSVQVTNEGGLWDTSMNLYPMFGGAPKEHKLEWHFPKIAVSFAHLEYEKDVLNFQGAQIPWIGFDELTHFSENQFFYMLSRNRSTTGVKPRVRATCNPDPDSWVKRFISWWLDDEGRFPRPERSGKIRWFVRINDSIHWANSREEIYEKFGKSDEIQPKSVTFIAAKLEDNKILMSRDPAYKANLLAMNRVDRLRLLYGDWNVRANAGSLFQRPWFKVVDAIPAGFIRSIRFWDRAATKPSETNRDPDWTRGLKLLRYPDNTFLVADLKSCRDTPGQVERLILNTASHDGRNVAIKSQQDPGSAGKAEAEYFVRMLAGYNVSTVIYNQDKETRAKPVSAQSEVGNILVLKAAWNEEFFTELENFPEGAHDDVVDTLSGAFNELCGGFSIADVL